MEEVRELPPLQSLQASSGNLCQCEVTLTQTNLYVSYLFQINYFFFLYFNVFLYTLIFNNSQGRVRCRSSAISIGWDAKLNTKLWLPLRSLIYSPLVLSRKPSHFTKFHLKARFDFLDKTMLEVHSHLLFDNYRNGIFRNTNNESHKQCIAWEPKSLNFSKILSK